MLAPAVYPWSRPRPSGGCVPGAAPGGACGAIVPDHAGTFDPGSPARAFLGWPVTSATNSEVGAMYVEQDTIVGELVGGARRPVRSFGPGRVCADPGCDAVLSIYNSNDRCAAHDFDPTLCSFRVPPVHPGQAASSSRRRGHRGARGGAQRPRHAHAA